MIRLYRHSKYGFPLVSSVLLAACSIVTIPTFFDRNLWYVFTLQSKPYYFWQLFSGIFEHSIHPSWFLWVHFAGNMSMALVFGMLLERLLGSYKMLLLTLWAAFTHVLFFQLRFLGQYSMGSGASGIVYAYAPIALYIMIRYISTAKPAIHKDPAFYLVAAEFTLAWIVVTALASWNETNVYHVVATLSGFVFLLACKKTVDREIASACTETAQKPNKKSKWLHLLWLLPAMLASILLLYQCGKLNGMFLDPVGISNHFTAADVTAHGNTIEIAFDRPITKFGSTYTSGADMSAVEYSGDGKSVYIRFPNGIANAYRAELRNARGLDGKIVREIVIVVGE
jgi:membrane associated rhomboid family serine protease